MIAKTATTLCLALTPGAFVAFLLHATLHAPKAAVAAGDQSPSEKSSDASAKGKPSKDAEPGAGKVQKGRFVLHSKGLPERGMWKCHPVLADFNHDGQLDLAAISRKDPGLRAWLGSSNGTWTNSAKGLQGQYIYGCGGGVDVGDLNQDGHPDLAVADHCYGVSIFLGDGTGSWKSHSPVPQVANPDYKKIPSAPEFMGTEDLALGDFDKDGILDVVIGGSESGGIRAFKGTKGAKSWTLSSSGLPDDGFANTVLFADMNKDGNLDIVAAHEEGPRVYHGDGKGGWSDKSIGLSAPTVGGLFHEVAVGDLNGDGRLDLVAANWVDGVEMFFQTAEATWEKRPDVFPELKGGAVGIGVRDITGDGHLDIVLTGRKPYAGGTVFGIFALLGNGRGEFTVHRGELPDTGLDFSWCFAFGDVNKDGIDDFVAAIGGHVPVDANAPVSEIKSKLQVWCWQPEK